VNSVDGPILRDIHLPPPPTWWPPAPGWWLLATIALVCLILTLMWLRKLVKMRRRENAVLRELDRCIECSRHDPVALAAALSHFLRRLTLGDTAAAAAYHGERWLEYLDQRSSSSEFRQGVGRVLIEAPFRPTMSYDTVALIALVRRWTRRMLDAGATHA